MAIAKILTGFNSDGTSYQIYPISNQALIYNNEGKSTKQCFDEITSYAYTVGNDFYSAEEVLTASNVELNNRINGLPTYSYINANYAKKGTTLADYGITDSYTKSEINSKISAVFYYKGSVASYANLPAASLIQTGWTYNVNDTGANYVWNGSSWDKLSETIDLNGKADWGTKLSDYRIADAYISGSTITLGSQSLDVSNVDLSDYTTYAYVTPIIERVEENEFVTAAALVNINSQIQNIKTNNSYIVANAKQWDGFEIRIASSMPDSSVPDNVITFVI